MEYRVVVHKSSKHVMKKHLGLLNDLSVIGCAIDRRVRETATWPHHLVADTCVLECIQDRSQRVCS